MIGATAIGFGEIDCPKNGNGAKDERRPKMTQSSLASLLRRRSSICFFAKGQIRSQANARNFNEPAVWNITQWSTRPSTQIEAETASPS
ncbi:hypothetical protein RB6909 [Rhodopirellula baltica SH 1]|uniref:Uncharacterized protein n=1 Tax=Rhodopirellula baltica (strain DSM 10527 / NCIMB 13988 / SH1) TaxID=243090 RepID=Q7UPI9_RHOBA|nr:hypothetical protein RB6909 [Rhodopirellula baltica SH 1]